MPRKIAFIGAGSFGFTRSLVRDLLSFPALADADISLMDVDPERLDAIYRACKRIAEEGHYPANITATTDRVEALKGADGVVTTILQGGCDVWQHDILIPKKYGVDTNVGDTRGPSGIFRYLRTINPILDIAADIDRYCPGAVYLNYTNPMAMLCRTVQGVYPHLTTSGLCHSVQGTASMLAKWIGAKDEEVTYTCAGINHQAFYTEFLVNGKDAYPLIRKAVTERPEVYNEEIVRNEMFLALGYYVTESSGHNSEYNAWFRKRPDLIEKYCKPGTGWNPGEYAYILHLARRNRQVVQGAGGSQPRPRVRRVHLQRHLRRRRDVQVQRQCAQLRPDRQSARGLLRRGARAGQPPRSGAHPRGQDAAPARHPQRNQRPDRGNGRAGQPHRRPRAGLSGHLLRPADRRRLLAARDPLHGGRDVRHQRAVPDPVQEVT